MTGRGGGQVWVSGATSHTFKAGNKRDLSQRTGAGREKDQLALTLQPFRWREHTQNTSFYVKRAHWLQAPAVRPGRVNRRSPCSRCRCCVSAAGCGKAAMQLKSSASWGDAALSGHHYPAERGINHQLPSPTTLMTVILLFKKHRTKQSRRSDVGMVFYLCVNRTSNCNVTQKTVSSLAFSLFVI